jgi:hypothetical protein
MCQHCDSLLRYVPQLQGNKPQAVELVALVLEQIRVAHKFKPLQRASRAKVALRDALRRIESAAYTFYARANQANYFVIAGTISAYWSARLRANDKKPSRALNPRGKSEPHAAPRIHRIPPCWIHDKESNNPAHIVAHIDYARHAITCNNEHAERLFRSADRLAQEGSNDAAHLQASFAHGAVRRSNCIENQLTEYRSIHSARR